MAEPQQLGDYRLQRCLGEGGMGEVWEAQRLSDGVHVALKRLRPGGERSAMPPSRFLAEAKLGASLIHPNLVRVLDAGVDGTQPFFVMELLRGASFASLCLQNPSGLPPGLVVELGLQILSGLAFIHAVPVVHRDLKPSNLFLTEDGQAKVFDFGIALSLDSERTETATGLVRGSLPYVSPEQAHGDPVTLASDLFSVALVLHELLTGVRVMNQGSDAAVLTALLWKPLPSVRARRPELPEALERTLKHALEKAPTQRPASADAWAAELSQSLTKEARWSAQDVALWAKEHLSQPTLAATHTADVRAVLVAPPPATEARPARNARNPVLLTAALLALAAAGTATFSHLRAKPVTVPVNERERAPVPEPAPVPEKNRAPAPVPQQLPEQFPVPQQLPRTQTPVPAKQHHVRSSNSEGWLTVDAQPTYAEITLDGKRLGPTPLYRIHVPAGPHVLNAIREDGLRRTRTLRVAADKESLVLFRW